MNDDLYPIKHSIFFSFVFGGLLISVFFAAGVETPGFYTSLTTVTQNEILSFIRVVYYLLSTFCILYIAGLISYGILYLVYRVSLRYIYSKPCRVYPVEKSKDDKLFSLR